MEAFMWRHTPQARRFLELLPEVGTLQAIRATFSFRIGDPADVRLRADLDGGSLMDVGCYAVSGARLVAGSEPDVGRVADPEAERRADRLERADLREQLEEAPCLGRVAPHERLHAVSYTHL